MFFAYINFSFPFKGILCEIPLNNVVTTTPITSTTTTSTDLIESTTTAIKIKQCPENLNICKNNGLCLILNELTIYCSCNSGYSGLLYLKMSTQIINFFKTFIGILCDVFTGVTSTTTTKTKATTITTTIPNTIITSCPSNTIICKNDGQCFIVNSVSILCSCKSGFSGINID